MAVPPGIACVTLVGLHLLASFLPRYVFSQTTGDLRLMSGGQSSQGRVEIFDGREWGTVCDDEWDDADAEVVCRQLGYSPERAQATYMASFGQGTGPIHLDNVECSGSELRLLFCPRPQEQNNCDHYEDAGVICVPMDGEVRLVGGTSANEGRVEVYHDQSWGTVCDNLWDSLDAQVVCRQVGFPTEYAQALSNAYFGSGRGHIFMDHVRCDGQEDRLASCTFSGWYTYSCAHSEDAGVRCNTSPPANTPSSVVIGILSSLGVFMLILLTITLAIKKRASCRNLKPLYELHAMIHRKTESRTRSTEPPNMAAPLANLSTTSRNPSHTANHVATVHSRESSSHPINYDFLPLRVDLSANDAHLHYHNPGGVNNPLHVTGVDLNMNDSQAHLVSSSTIFQLPPPYDGPTADNRQPDADIHSSGNIPLPPPYDNSDAIDPSTISPPVPTNVSCPVSPLRIATGASDHLPPPYISSGANEHPSAPNSPPSVTDQSSVCHSPSSVNEQPPPYSPWRESTFV